MLTGLHLQNQPDTPARGASMTLADTPIEGVHTQHRMLRTPHRFRPQSLPCVR